MKRNGFTLIELLAVIVILAIIAIIAVPVVLNVIEKAKEGSAVDSAYGYIHAIENSVTLREIRDKEVVENGKYEDLREFETTNKVEIKGSIPSSGYFILEKRQVVEAEFIIDGYIVICDKRICRSNGKNALVTVKYELNGGTLDKKSEKVEKGKTLGTIPTPEKNHYGFDGWYTENDGHGEKITTETVFDEDVTLYAHYIKNKYTVVLENAKFTDGETTKALSYNEEIEILAIIPDNYTESSYSGNASCSSSSDVGNTKYKVKHEYSIENWNVENTTNDRITYRVEGNQTVIANIKDTATQIDKYECKSEDASYSSGYYYCPSGGSISGTTCTVTSTYEAECTYKCCIENTSSCQNTKCDVVRGCREGSFTCTEYLRSCKCQDEYVITQTCSSTSTYSASYSSGYYYCSSGTRDGSKCYVMRSIS